MAPFGTQSANRSAGTGTRAPRGTTLSCKGWAQEAALRLLMNSLDPAVSEDPENLKICSTVGKVAQDPQALQGLIHSIEKLEPNKTLVIEDGVARGARDTSEDAPRVIALASGDAVTQRYATDWMFTGPASALPETIELFRSTAQKHFGETLAGRLIVSAGMGGAGGAQALAATLNGGAFLGIDADAARIKRRVKAGFCEVMVNNLDEALRILKNAVRKREPASVGLIGNAANILPELAERGVLPDLLTDQTPADDFVGAYIPAGLTPMDSAELHKNQPDAFRQMLLDSIITHARAMLKLKELGAVLFEYGNGIFGQSVWAGIPEARDIPKFSDYLEPQWMAGFAVLTAIALSGDPDDLARVDTACESSSLSSSREIRKWIDIGRRLRPAGLPARNFWVDAAQSADIGEAINRVLAEGAIKAPVALGRSLHRTRPCPTDAQNPRNHELISRARAGGDEIDAAVRTASGASWAGLRKRSQPNFMEQASVVLVADGSPSASERIRRVFSDEFAAGLFAF